MGIFQKWYFVPVHTRSLSVDANFIFIGQRSRTNASIFLLNGHSLVFLVSDKQPITEINCQYNTFKEMLHSIL